MKSFYELEEYALVKDVPIMQKEGIEYLIDELNKRNNYQDALEKMMENRTSLVIAHRLSTIQKADWIVVMEKGDIVEQGTHSVLLKNKSEYYNLVENQLENNL